MLRPRRLHGVAARAASHAAPRKRTDSAARPRVESLEWRQLLSTGAVPPGLINIHDAEPNDTADLAQSLGDVTATPVAVSGWLGNGPAGRSDVDWYQFHLDRPAHVELSRTSPDGSAAQAVVSLYNNDVGDYSDPFNPTGYRLLAQDQDAGDRTAAISRDLAPGTYEVAVSGGGNLYFHPLLAGSGYAGSTGSYALMLSAVSLATDSATGPFVVSSEPADGATVAASPFVLRLGMSAALDPSTLVPGQTVFLTYNPTGTFGDGNDQDVPINWVNFSGQIDELQVAPAAPLAAGSYRLRLTGDAGQGAAVTDLDGAPLGGDASHPTGQDRVVDFTVAPSGGSHDTPRTAYQLGDFTGSGIIQASGAIGVDASFDPSVISPANQVDMYHFEVMSGGTVAFHAEVFAGRLGSSLDAGLSLYKLDPVHHTLILVAGNNNSLNGATATDGSRPMAFDPYLEVALDAGDYYVVVSSSLNTASPIEGLKPEPGSGIYDPTLAHSGQNGISVGPYVLNLLLSPVSQPAEVTRANIADGDVLTSPPTEFSVTFDQPVNLPQLAFASDQVLWVKTLACVYFEDESGARFYPRVVGYDSATNTATFQLDSRLHNGLYELHLSGSLGLANTAGQPLVGNDPSGDHVVRFSVAAAAPPFTGGVNSGFAGVVAGPASTPVDLGVLFNNETSAGVTLDRTHTAGSSEASTVSDDFTFTVFQTCMFTFSLSGDAIPNGTTIQLFDDADQPIGRAVAVDAATGTAHVDLQLQPGSYHLRVGAWVAADAIGVAYQLKLVSQGAYDNPYPLFNAPAPALQMHIDPLPVGPPIGIMPPSSPIVADPPAAGPSFDPAGPISIGFNAFVPLVTSLTVAGAPGEPSHGSGPEVAGSSSTAGEFVALGVGPMGGAAGSSPTQVECTASSVQVALPRSNPAVPMSIAMLVVTTRCESLPDDTEAASPADEATASVDPDAATEQVAETMPIDLDRELLLDGMLAIGSGLIADLPMGDPLVPSETPAPVETPVLLALATDETPSGESAEASSTKRAWSLPMVAMGLVGVAVARIRMIGPGRQTAAPSPRRSPSTPTSTLARRKPHARGRGRRPQNEPRSASVRVAAHD